MTAEFLEALIRQLAAMEQGEHMDQALAGAAVSVIVALVEERDDALADRDIAAAGMVVAMQERDAAIAELCRADELLSEAEAAGRLALRRLEALLAFGPRSVSRVH